MRKPWINPSMDHTLGAARGSWRRFIVADVVVVLVALTVIILAGADVLPRGAAYVAIPFAMIGGALAILSTILKARSESGDTTH